MIRRSISLFFIILMISTADSEPTLTGLLIWVALGLVAALFWMWAEHDDPSGLIVSDRTLNHYLSKKRGKK